MYLRKDKTVSELLAMAKENYAHPPLTADGPGVTIATIPVGIEDCEPSSHHLCDGCGRRNDHPVCYSDRKTREILCVNCMTIEPLEEILREKQKKIKERGDLVLYDCRQPFFCDVCDHQPDQEDTNIFCRARPGCDCNYYKCWTCTVMTTTAEYLETIMPGEICNIIVDFLSLQQRSWGTIKSAKLPPGHSNFTFEAKLRSKFSLQGGAESRSLPSKTEQSSTANGPQTNSERIPTT